jgi:DNA-binding MarR family transcriptional regulator
MKLSETIDYQIKATWHSLTKMHNTIALQYGISQSEAFVLIAVEKEGSSAKNIAAAMGIEPTSMSRLLLSMEEKGFICKEPDKIDKRIIRIFLTEKGVEHRKLAKQTIFNFNNKVQNQISERKLKTFFKVIAKINEIIEKEKECNKE